VNIYAMKKPKRLNAVSVTLAGIVLVLAYVIWFLVPAFWPIFQLTGIMRGACNDAYRVLDDEKVMEKMLRDAKRTKLRLSLDNFRLTRIPYTEEEMAALTKDNPTARDLLQKRGKECVIELRYQDQYEWPLIGQTTAFTFEREVRAPLETIKWEKSCTCVTTSPR
jgi:hypothetical protein